MKKAGSFDKSNANAENHDFCSIEQNFELKIDAFQLTSGLI